MNHLLIILISNAIFGLADLLVMFWAADENFWIPTIDFTETISALILAKRKFRAKKNLLTWTSVPKKSPQREASEWNTKKNCQREYITRKKAREPPEFFDFITSLQN